MSSRGSRTRRSASLPSARRQTGRRIGAHLPLGRGMLKTLERALEIGANALQIFTDNPTAWRRRSQPPPELPTFRERRRELEIAPLATHASYLINLAGPEDVFYERSIELLARELEAGRLYEADYVNVHIGSHRGAGLDAGIGRLGQGIARVLERVPERAGETERDVGAASDAGALAPLLVLENSAAGGGGVGATVDELRRIVDEAAGHGATRERIGFCFDTAHLWAAGHDLRDRPVLDELLAAFDEALGIERLVLVHLNDSKAALGSHLDRHEHVGAGQIGEQGMGNVVRHLRLAHAAFIIETPGMDEGYDAINLERVRCLLEERALPELPPEAMLVSGSRSRRSLPAAAR